MNPAEVYRRLRRGRTEEQVWATDPSPASGPAPPAGQGLRRARPGAKSRTLKRQSILPVGLHDRTQPASLGDGQLRGALRTVGLIHGLLAELAITNRPAQTGQSPAPVPPFCARPPSGWVSGEFFRSLRYPTKPSDRDGITHRAGDPVTFGTLGSGTASRSPPIWRELI